MTRPHDDFHPLPLALQLERLRGEWKAHGTLFGLSRREIFRPEPGADLSMVCHGRCLQTPLGPAAGPHTQLSHNLVIAWLLGSRFLELKTVQVRDDLEIPRPSIDTRTLGLNVEWSQELRVDQSLHEYVRAWMLIHAILAEGWLEVPDEEWSAWLPCFDVSVGYDLAGLQSEKIQGFMESLRDASQVIEAELSALRRARCRWRGPVPSPRVADSVTLSTFHGCPKPEIEAMARFLLDRGWHTIVKLNPTQLPRPELEEILYRRLGFADLEVNPRAYELGLSLEDARTLIENLRRHAATGGAAGFGVKLTNTLEVVNRGSTFADPVVYLSGRPLHALAIALGVHLRESFGPDLSMTFSAGLDADNVAEVLASGFGPVTTCTDMLTGSGFRKLPGYFRKLRQRMEAAQAGDLDELARSLGGQADPGEASMAFLRAYRYDVLEDPRYHHDRHRSSPKKVGSTLDTWDCLGCDKCLRICPNSANFSLELEPFHGPSRSYLLEGANITEICEETLHIEKRVQYANLADLCNRCSLCDQWCPEDGGPYVVKPRFFTTPESFAAQPDRDGFLLTRDRHGDHVTMRREGRVMRFDMGKPHRCHIGDLVLTLDAEGRPLLMDGTAPDGAVRYRSGDWRVAQRLHAAITGGSRRDHYLRAALELSGESSAHGSQE